LLVSSFFLFSQPAIRQDFTLVIAQSGLNIRAQPSLGAEVLIKAPYLSELVYLSRESFGRDTIGELKSFIRHHNPQGVLVETDVPLAGDWVKVKYQGKTGYTFNAYLGPNQDRPKSSDYFVISPGENCGDAFFDLTKYHCYGIYESGDQTEIREVKASYVVQETGIGFLAPLLTTEENHGLKLVIGSKRVLPTYSSDFTLNNYTAVWPRSSEDKPVDACGMFSVEKVIDTLSNGFDKALKNLGSFTLGTRKQLVLEEYFTSNISVIGCGDLDGDDQVDYIIRCTVDEPSRKMLYLSSKAKEGEILGLACEEFFGYCC